LSAPASARRTLALILGAVGFFGLGLALLVGVQAPAWTFPLVALVGGGLTGLVFPTAVACLRARQEEAGRVAARLYGADLAGACLGAVLASVLLVPVLGIVQTCLVVGLVGVAGVLLLL
jgi:spermidine synthase